jgi:hypothetical protein
MHYLVRLTDSYTLGIKKGRETTPGLITIMLKQVNNTKQRVKI